MPMGPTDPQEFGRLVALGQVGMEMVVPVALGLALDHYLGWNPWGVVVGAFVGFFGGLAHLVALLNRHDRENSNKPPRDVP